MFNYEDIKTGIIRRFFKKDCHLVEVGVYIPRYSQVKDFIYEDCRIQMFEPQSKCYDELMQYFGACSNVKIYKYAITNKKGKATLKIPVQKYGGPDSSGSSYIDGINSPYLNKRYDEDRIFQETKEEEVKTRTFDEFDDGTIDMLFLDCEGCEWFVIKNMKSRPQVISLETGKDVVKDKVKEAINPFYNEIEEWMKDNNYKPCMQVGSDTIYVQNLIPKTNAEIMEKYVCSQHRYGFNECPECFRKLNQMIIDIEINENIGGKK